MVKFLVTLRSGGDYHPEHVVSLMRQLRRNVTVAHEFICYTDTPINHALIKEIPLISDWPGWWACIEMFRESGPCIATGLDSIIINNIDYLFELALTCPKDVFYMTRPQPRAMKRGKKYCSGIMMWNGDWSWVFNEFDPRIIKKLHGDQDYTLSKLIERKIEIRKTQDYFQGFYGFKQETKRGKALPSDAKMIGFHGKPRPWECTDVDWVMKAYHDETIPETELDKLLKEKKIGKSI